MLGKVQLATSKNNKNKFESNKTDEFTVEAVDIGRIKKIKYAFIRYLPKLTPLVVK